MNTSSRLLSQPRLAPEARPLAPPPPAADPFVQGLLAEAARDSYQRGLTDGRAAARAELDAALDRVREAFAAVRADVADLRRARAEADVVLAEQIATVVLGAEPHDGGRALLERLGQAMAELDDEPLRVRVHHGDAALVAAALEDLDQVSVEADSTLAPGEGVVDGAYASADLTRAAAWEAVRAALDGQGRAAP